MEYRKLKAVYDKLKQLVEVLKLHKVSFMRWTVREGFVNSGSMLYT